MATVIEELVTIYKMDPSSYQRGGRVITNTTQNMKSALSGMMAAVAALAGVSGGIGLFGLARSSMQTAANLEALKLGLASVTGSASLAEQEFAKLREVAKLPGLGMQEAVQGATRLMAAGLSADQARAALQAFGNALATVGGGKAELAGVTLALSQIQAKGKVSAEEILQLQERLPQIRVAMQAAFGTSDTEVLQRRGIGSAEFIAAITKELAKLPQVAGGAKNAFENLGDNALMASAQIGNALNKFVVPIIDRVSTRLEKLVDSGAFEAITTKFTRLFDSGAIGVGLDSAIDKALAMVERIPEFFAENKGAIVGTFSAIIGGAQAIGGALKTVAPVARQLLDAFVGLPAPIKEGVAALLLLNKATGGLVGSVIGSGGAGSIIGKAIMTPVGMIGSTLMAGAVYLADLIEKGVGKLAYDKAKELNRPIQIVETDPKTGKRFTRRAGAEDFEKSDRAFVEEHMAEALVYDAEAARELMNAKAKKTLDELNQGLTDSGKPTTDHLANISTGIARLIQIQERMFDFHRSMLGGGDAMANQLDPATIAGMKSRQAQKIMKFAEVVMDGAWDQASEMLRRNSRGR